MAPTSTAGVRRTSSCACRSAPRSPTPTPARSSPISPRTGSRRSSRRAARAASATSTSSRARTARRASSRPAKRDSSGGCISSSRCWPTSACSACRMRARARSFAPCRRRGPRSPITRSRRWRRTWASCAPTRTAASSSRTSPVSSRARPTAPGSATSSSATCSARACCCTSSTSRRSTRTPIRSATRRAIVAELKRYDVALFEKSRWLVLNKIDLVPESERAARVRAFVKAYGWKGPVFAVAAVNGEGCRALVFKIQDWLDAHPAPAPSRRHSASPRAGANCRQASSATPRPSPQRAAWW